MFQRTTLLVAAAVVSASACVVVLSLAAQVSPGRDGGGPGPSMGQADGSEDIQAQIRASDEEWKVIGPKLMRVMAASVAVEASLDESNSGGPSSMPMGAAVVGGPVAVRGAVPATIVLPTRAKAAPSVAADPALESLDGAVVGRRDSRGAVGPQSR